MGMRWMALSCAALLAAPAARAEDTSTEAVVVAVHHTPRNQALAGRPLSLHASVAGDWKLGALYALARGADQREFTRVPFARAPEGDYLAVIPASVVRRAGLLYAIVSEAGDGETRDHFATQKSPHAVVVHGRSPSEEQEEQLARYGGHRARFTAAGSVVAYGTRLQTDADGHEGESDAYSDRYWQGDVEFLYRPLNVVHDFRLGFHALRGEWSEIDGEAPDRGRSPGLYYAHGEVNFEVHRWFSVGLRPIIGVNAAGFVVGGGGAARVGDIAGTHFQASVDGIGEVGYLSDLRFHWATVPGFPMALGVEFSNWPASDESGGAANLSYDVGWEMTDRWTVALRLGTAQRDDSLSTGGQGRLALHYDL